MDAMTLGGFLRGAACCFLQKGTNLSIQFIVLTPQEMRKEHLKEFQFLMQYPASEKTWMLDPEFRCFTGSKPC
jgi:hypothetical protein